MAAPELRRWEVWCECFDDVEHELQTLFHTRWMWRTLLDVLEVSGVEQYVVVQNYFIRTYATTMCSAVRREVDPDTRTTSLARCLQRLIDWPNTMTRSRFVAACLAAGEEAVSSEAEANGLYDAFAPSGGDCIDSAVVQRCTDQIQSAAEPIKRYTDRVIAHRQSSTGETEPVSVTIEAIDAAVDTLGAIAKEFYGLRYPGTMLLGFTPVVDLQFLKMFRKPWFPEGSLLPSHPSRSIFD